MAEYQQLQYQLLLVTLSIALIIFITVWIVYSLPTALNYLLGGCTGVVYLKMLARDVARLGNQKNSLGYARLAPFIGLMIIATRWHDLQIVPIFLGFLTYKAAIIAYVLKTSFS
ncbi:MAG: ATP synthase subunit I [Coleofasciculaceae cyanobacterium SM2_1_6]|nr:ATP synthase subunit I [Coleofasciculaceae cyanobacterium SM2_1_6]